MPIVELNIQNPGFETGDLTGWTISPGFRIYSPWEAITISPPEWPSSTVYPDSGLYMACPMVPPTLPTYSYLNQSINLAINGVSDYNVDIERTSVLFSCRVHCYSQIWGATAKIGMIYYDEFGVLIAADYAPGYADAIDTWHTRRMTKQIPIGTRDILIRLSTVAGLSWRTQAYFDEATFTADVVTLSKYPYPCRDKGTKIVPVQNTSADFAIDGTGRAVNFGGKDTHYRITSVNTHLTEIEKDTILDHYKTRSNILSGFTWSVNMGGDGEIDYHAAYEDPPDAKWIKNAYWQVTSKLYASKDNIT